MTPQELEGRLLALRKVLAQVLARWPQNRTAELISAVLLPTGEEDPAVLAEDLDPQSAAMGQEIAALLDEADRLRRGYG
jgi:hypothetical protein